MYKKRNLFSVICGVMASVALMAVSAVSFAANVLPMATDLKLDGTPQVSHQHHRIDYSEIVNSEACESALIASSKSKKQTFMLYSDLDKIQVASNF